LQFRRGAIGDVFVAIKLIAGARKLRFVAYSVSPTAGSGSVRTLREFWRRAASIAPSNASVALSRQTQG
jgi:hypothetical protein